MSEVDVATAATHLRKLWDADCGNSQKTGNGTGSRTSVEVANRGRASLDAYTEALRELPGLERDGPKQRGRR